MEDSLFCFVFGTDPVVCHSLTGSCMLLFTMTSFQKIFIIDTAEIITVTYY